MNELTEEEFRERALTLHHARKIFIESGLTNNITRAFEAYQEILAKYKQDIFVSTMVYGNEKKTFMDFYERPSCPTCGSSMKFRLVPENTERIVTQLVCSNSGCDIVLNSEKDLNWWMQNLKKK